jgi:SAM-dependent methyltransferase
VSLKSALKQYVPSPILSRIQRAGLRHDMYRSEGRTHKEIFSEIYERDLWRGESGTYSSGPGSHEQVNESYINLVLSLIEREKVGRIVDLGCGDFRVGQRIVGFGAAYVGCDVCPSVIERNSRVFGHGDIDFKTIDIVTDPLPRGDLCIIRQVFQHLSNGSILTVLQKTLDYRLVLVTDEQVRGDEASRNVDILPFHGTRRLFGQGLRLERAPFDQKIDILLEHSSGSNYGPATATYLRTVLIRNQLPYQPADRDLKSAWPVGQGMSMNAPNGDRPG